ncbi:MAG: DNA polymerase III subunit delta [Candidatus Omnitrophota bacterium]
MVTRHSNYLFIGQDPYPREKAINAIRSRLLDDASAQFNLGIFHAQDNIMKDAVSFARTAPFGGSHRVVIIKNAGELSQADVGILAAYLETPAASATIILDSAGPVKGKAWESVKARVGTMVFDARKDKTGFRDLVDEMSKTTGKRFSDDSVRLLRDLIGENDMATVRNEMLKLAAFAGTRKEISKGDVETAVGRRTEEDIFRLVNAISEKDAGRAFDIVSSLSRRRVRPHEVLGILAWHYRKRYEQSGGMSRKKFSEITDFLLETDLSIKRSRLDALQALEVAVTKLCSG